jgi:hypothetical protein
MGGTSGSGNALSYNDWVKANPNKAVGAGGSGPVRNISELGSYKAGLSDADSQKAYQDYVSGLGSGDGVSGNQAAINMVMNSPGYMGGLQQGQQTLNAGLARTGQIGSGAERLALQNYGQDYFNQQYQNLYNQYSGLSMATASPLDMSRQNAINNAAIETNTTNRGAAGGGFERAISGVQNAFGSVSNLFGGSSSSYTPNNYVAGYNNSPPINITGGGISTSAGMGTPGQSAAYTGGGWGGE